ncbi:cyanocobalamin reductase / alkylcobalamin dealkylase isoform X1 [Lissotriton helveticus]
MAAPMEQAVRDFLAPLGFEVYPFKVHRANNVGWYNAILQPGFHLQYQEDTLAFVVLSTPSMFEKAFKPFISQQLLQRVRDPVDECVSYYISALKKSLPEQKVDVMYDYEMLPSRRPKVLIQTAAHVAGAAYYYQRSDVQGDPWGEKKMYGVCIHPQFGGWFAIRAVLVFPDVQAPSLKQKAPADCIASDEKRIALLESFNFRWKDWEYRDFVDVQERYSEEQKTYFATPPSERLNLLGLQGELEDGSHY